MIMCVYICMFCVRRCRYVCKQTFQYRHDPIQCQLLRGVLLLSSKAFPYLRSVAIRALKRSFSLST